MSPRFRREPPPLVWAQHSKSHFFRYWLVAAGCWLLAAGCWLLVNPHDERLCPKARRGGNPMRAASFLSLSNPKTALRIRTSPDKDSGERITYYAPAVEASSI